tara:strand:- start:2598 stop:3107 length:510 start_codon:yes stop_codon:yes gene_type:complete
MTLKEYAAKVDVPYTTLIRWAAAGRLPSLRKKGRTYMISDKEALDREIEGTKSPDRGGTSGAPDLEGALRKQEADQRAVPSFARSRAIREAFTARLCELDYRLKSEKLVDKAEMKLHLAKMHMGLRDSLKAIPDRVAPIIAAETEQTKIHSMLMREIGSALENLSGNSY